MYLQCVPKLYLFSHGNCYSLGNDGVWSQGPSLKVPRYGAPSVSWGNGDRILIMGGVKAKPVNGTWTETTSIEEVDFSRQTSKEIGNLPVNIYYACATNQNGKIHVIGGIQDDGWASRRTWISKVENFDWSQGPDLIDRRRWLACAYVPKWNITLVTGGQGSFFAEILTNNQFIRGRIKRDNQVS